MLNHVTLCITNYFTVAKALEEYCFLLISDLPINPVSLGFSTWKSCSAFSNEIGVTPAE